MRTYLIAAAALLAPALAHAHGVEMTVEQTTVQAGTVHLSFILQTPDGEEVTDQELAETQTKKLHFQIFDQGLAEFRHVHPEYSAVARRWEVDVQLPVNGKYRLYAEGTIAEDSDEFTAPGKIEVSGGLQANTVPSSLGDHRTGAAEVSVATLDNTVFRAGRLASPILRLSRTDGRDAVITPYLGVPAHVTATPLTGTSLVHIHPAATSPTATELTLHLKFARAGDYRVWVEFVEGGAYRLVPLSVTVLP